MTETYDEMIERHKKEIQEKQNACTPKKLKHLEPYSMHLLVAPGDLHPIIGKINEIIDYITKEDKK